MSHAVAYGPAPTTQQVTTADPVRDGDTPAEGADVDDPQHDAAQPEPQSTAARVPPAEGAPRPVWSAPLARSGAPTPVIWTLGAHGGAGASTLARVWTPAADARGGWPAADEVPFVVVVARMHRTGLRAAQAALLSEHTGCRVLGLVIVATGPGKPASSLQHLRRTVVGSADSLGAPAWDLPWIPELLDAEPDRLAQWQPGTDSPDRGRFARPVSVTEAPHPAFAEIGSEVFDRARRLWQS